MADYSRAARLSDRIRVILAERLERGLRDPRLGFVTITDVKVTGDLQHASVFYTVLGTDEERQSSAEALKAATGMLRSEVGKHLNVRLTPSLEFIADAIPENAAPHRRPAARSARARRGRGGARRPAPATPATPTRTSSPVSSTRHPTPWSRNPTPRTSSARSSTDFGE